MVRGATRRSTSGRVIGPSQALRHGHGGEAEEHRARPRRRSRRSTSPSSASTATPASAWTRRPTRRTWASTSGTGPGRGWNRPASTSSSSRPTSTWAAACI
ncbi:MAG: hypothetical protein MZU84_01755 [Sphingobacterium sp.]|nr:hypothetical protein [Sphingobacterium sp.]